MNTEKLNSMDRWLKTGWKPLLIAGPCSVESEEQMMQTAQGIAAGGKASALRGGVWKPRTSPGSFEGIGVPALQWLKNAGRETQMPVCTEVANARHVEEALKAEIDILWLGARTTVNPFFVQEIADALEGVDVPVMVKNPIHPELGLWLGAMERLNKAGIDKMAAIHRGFYAYHSEPFRNDPKWEVYFSLREALPDLPIICDPSHIAGRRSLVKEVCQSALDLGMNGFMIETHYQPDKALSDPLQQLRPQDLDKLMESLETRAEKLDDDKFVLRLEELRTRIDEVDTQIIALLENRIDIVREIAAVKDENQLMIFQMKRWFKVLESRAAQAGKSGLEEKIIRELFQLIHKYSIEVQIKAQQDKPAQKKN